MIFLMENNEKTIHGDLPQDPPPKPPDQDDQDDNQRSVEVQSEGIPKNGANEPNEAMSEGSSEDEMPMVNALEQQPTDTTKNGVRLPVKSAGETGEDHAGTGDGPAAVSLDHVGDQQPPTTENSEVNLPKSASDPGGDHVGTAEGGSGVISRDHVGTSNRGPGDNVPPSAPDHTAGKNPKSRNLDKQETKVSKRHFDKQMSELINAIRDLATEQHTDNLKMESRLGVSTHISQDAMQLTTELGEIVKESHRVLLEKIGHVEDRICATQNSANDALSLATDVKTSINGMAEAVTKCDRQLAVYTKVGEKLEGFLKENQSPKVRQDSKRLKRVWDQPQTPQQTTTSQDPAPMVQATPQSGEPQNATRQSAAPPGTVIRNGSLATTMVGPNGTLVLRKPVPEIPGTDTANPGSRGAVPRTRGLRETVRMLANNPRTLRTVTDGTYTTTDGTPTLRLPRPSEQGPNQNANRNGPTHPKQDSYAAIAAASASTVPGLNLDSQRTHHTRNNRGAYQGPPERNSGLDKQPTKVRQDHFSISPNTGHVKRVEAYKTVPYKSEKQKGKENSRHLRNINQVSCELVLFNIPTKNKNGDIMTKEQDRARVSKFLRELKIYGYDFKNGDVVGSARQWKNTRHPEYIPITITFCDEDTRYQAEEAALEGGLKGHRTPREEDVMYDRIGFIRRSLSERERKELKIRRDKRNSPAGIAFAEIKRREDNSRSDRDDWADYDVEGDEDPILAVPANEYMAPMEMATDNNNPNAGGAMAEEDMLQKIEDMRKAYDNLRNQNEQRNQAAFRANREAETEVARRTKEATAARQAEEEKDESDWEFFDPIATETINFRGNVGPSTNGPRNTAPNLFAAEPTFNYTENLDLNQPNLQKPEEVRPQVNIPTQSGDESSASECEYA